MRFACSRMIRLWRETLSYVPRSTSMPISCAAR